MTTKQIQVVIQKHCVLKGHKVVCPNVSNFFMGECDVISATVYGYAYEYEIKISRSDFLADRKKKHKHETYKNVVGERAKSKCPNYFIYVVPVGLVSVDELPHYAGLIYIEGEDLEVVKPPVKLHDKTVDIDKLINKALQLYQQRDALGCTLLTHLNREKKEAFAKREEERKERTQKLIEYAKTISSNND